MTRHCSPFYISYSLLFYKNQQLSAEAGQFLIFWRFQPQIVLKLFLFSAVIFPNSGLVARNNKRVLRNMCLQFFYSAECEKLETVSAAFANVTNLLITLPALDDPAKSSKSFYTCTSQPVYKD